MKKVFFVLCLSLLLFLSSSAVALECLDSACSYDGNFSIPCARIGPPLTQNGCSTDDPKGFFNALLDLIPLPSAYGLMKPPVIHDTFHQPVYVFSEEQREFLRIGLPLKNPEICPSYAYSSMEVDFVPNLEGDIEAVEIICHSIPLSSIDEPRDHPIYLFPVDDDSEGYYRLYI